METNKDKLQVVLEKPNDKLIAIDMDGVLCLGEWWGPEDTDPMANQLMIDFIWKLYKKGAHIII